MSDKMDTDYSSSSSDCSSSSSDCSPSSSDDTVTNTMPLPIRINTATDAQEPDINPTSTSGPVPAEHIRFPEPKPQVSKTEFQAWLLDVRARVKALDRKLAASKSRIKDLKNDIRTYKHRVAPVASSTQVLEGQMAASRSGANTGEDDLQAISALAKHLSNKNKRRQNRVEKREREIAVERRRQWLEDYMAERRARPGTRCGDSAWVNSNRRYF